MKYFLVAGENSGDTHGAGLMQEFKKIDLNAQFEFVGGAEMKSKGGVQRVDIKDLSVMGFSEVIKALPRIISISNKIKKAILNFKPDLIIFIDNPGLNLRLAKWAKAKKFTTCYYILPKVWAWKKGRIKSIKKYVDLPISILPFEVDFYKKEHLDVPYFGNPSVDKVACFRSENLSANKSKKKTIAIIPGSRIQEIKNILPTFYKAAIQFKECDVVVSKSPNISNELYESIIDLDKVKLSENYYDLLNSADVALVTSGTATLEAALFNLPQVVGYKTSYLTYKIAKMLVNLDYISLVNLIADKEIVIELIQEECNVESNVVQIKKLLDLDLNSRAVFYNSFFENMGNSGGLFRAASYIYKAIKPH